MAQAESDMKMRILLAAKRLFAEQGFDATSVRQICEAAGANVALVSYHFGGKEKVFNALFEHFFPSQRLHENEEVFRDPAAGMRLIITEVVLFSLTEVELSTILQQELIMNSPRKSVVTSFTFPLWRKVRELLENGQREGVFHFDSLDLALLYVVGSTTAVKKFMTFAPLLQEKAADPRFIAEQLCEMIMAGIGASGTRA